MQQGPTSDQTIQSGTAITTGSLGQLKAPLPDRFDCTHTSAQARLLSLNSPVQIAGRVRIIRTFGKLAFFTISDVTGTLQLSINRMTPKLDFDDVLSKLRPGNIIGASGTMYVSRTGEPTLQVEQFSLLSPAVTPLPVKPAEHTTSSTAVTGQQKIFGQIRDPHLLNAQPALKLLCNPGVRERFITRARVISGIRSFLEQHNFVEVESPILHPGDSGARAKPFITRHNASGKDRYLRVSPETYLKQAVAGGLDRVYEIGKSFRNEGEGADYLPEFTLLESYCAYANHEDGLRLVKDMMRHLLEKAHLTPPVLCKDIPLNLDGDWPIQDIRVLVGEKTGIDFRSEKDPSRIIAALSTEIKDTLHGNNLTYDQLIGQLYMRLVLGELIQPTVVSNYPAGANPLARRNASNPEVLDRYKVVIGASEIFHICSEIVDPVEQRARLEDQKRQRTAEQEPMLQMRENFIQCMEYGMPPMVGIGVGIDRLISVLTNQTTLKEVVLFAP